ncbi:hypothetical protein CK203_077479 [Vitis vinifera]|uniref:Uncharacterized protein n=1 Tax=Vitis vinifera TaxID=29760 RepID=A0A438DT92_VITVI|nr:hypothetical protein CK203_077479 [Vitis vinifera]
MASSTLASLASMLAKASRDLSFLPRPYAVCSISRPRVCSLVSSILAPQCLARSAKAHSTQKLKKLGTNETLWNLRGFLTTQDYSRMSYIILGLRINLDKNEILPVGRVENVELLALELGYKVGALPSTYLGLSLGAPHKSMAVWDGVEERIQKRLALWKRQYISKGGRITLIRSTLASMPIYLMSLMRPFCAIGVGVLRLKRSPCGSLLLVGSLGWKEEVGVLVKNKTLCDFFPSLYALVDSKDAWVADCWDSLGEEGGWNPRFSRSFNDWEVEVVESFLLTLQGKRLVFDFEDRVSCFRGTSFGALVFLLRCVSLLRKLHGKEETINHILIHYSKARVLWELVFALFGVMWVLPLLARDTLPCWHGSFVGKKHRKVWMAAPFVYFGQFGRQEKG